MSRSGIRDDVAPWSFFLPVTLAVVVGVLVAGWVQRAVDAVFGADRREEAMPAAVEADRAASARPEAAEADAVQDAQMQPAARAVATPQVESMREPPASPASTQTGSRTTEEAPPVLPGAIAAKRDGAPEACINGSIALRDANGWQQLLENDAPVPCTEQSSPPRQE